MSRRQRKKQLKKFGLYVDPKETWCLDYHFAKYALPRLRLFKKLNNGYPGIEDVDTPEKWDEAIDKMIRAFELIIFEEDMSVEQMRYYYSSDGEKDMDKFEEEIKEGLFLFAKWFRALWW